LPSSSVRSLNMMPAEAPATSQEGGMTHIATPAPASVPNMKTAMPMVIFASRLGYPGSRGGAICWEQNSSLGLFNELGDVPKVGLFHCRRAADHMKLWWRRRHFRK
jgi:hypothetical protein